MLDHTIALTTVVVVTQSLKIGQMIASSLGKGEVMMNREPDADSASRTSDARKVIALQDEEAFSE
jgi:hypothetical protein